MNNFAPTVGAASTHPTNMPQEHAALPVWNAENWFYEDWPVGQKIRSLRRTNNGNTWLDNSSFFGGDFGKRFAQPFFVIEINWRDHRNSRLDGVRSIESAT